ncbi:MAG: hypothetical protein KIS92_10530 [Planctomycetota bacterium]|nr:hypothetical protein [Planctomycetota bacterium]
MGCASAYADIVVLKNGKRLEGRVVENGDEVTVYTRFGTIKLERSRIESILPSKTVLDELEERVGALQEKIAADKPDAVAQGQLWYALAQWCGEKQLDRAREENLRRAIASDPEQPLARQALGYTKINGRWLTGEERQQALGLVKYQNQWVTPEARDDAERAASESRKRDLEKARDEADIRLKKAETDKLEAERKLLEAQAAQSRTERDRLDREWDELQRERSRLYDQQRYYGPYYYYPWGGYTNPNHGNGQGPKTAPQQSYQPYQPGSGLNNGVSGPGIPLLK